MARAVSDAADGVEGATVTDLQIGSPPRVVPDASLAPGDLLASRYRVLRYIAAGGMGEVYEADDTLLAERVAIKLLRPTLLKNPDAQARFGDEIRLARKVTHANVCRVFDVGVDGSRVFFTMELHSGETLATFLAQHGPLDLATAMPLVRQMLAGVGAAHEADVIHADLKPSNLLITGGQQHRVVVTDFGLATPCCAEVGCRCASPHLLGTPAYASPEQVEGIDVETSSDVFSLGVILFEMLSGSLPYHGATPADMARARLLEPAPLLRSLRPDVDPLWDDVVRRCLARRPDERPRDARALAAALGLD